MNSQNHDPRDPPRRFPPPHPHQSTAAVHARCVASAAPGYGAVQYQTLGICESVLERYLTMLAEHPDLMPPDMKSLIVEAALDVRRAREHMFLSFRQSLEVIPLETDQASLV